MKKFKKKGFTLIELIAVLVIMAILALIVTPLVMNIIRKARVSADKRSVDAYGRSIELAIAGYLLDTGKFPTEVSQLTIEYSGNKVVCSTTQINSDSSVYLAGCTVAERSVENYTYGSDKSSTYTAYEVGDEVRYNNVNYYVIKNSNTTEESVTLLKAEPLSVEEVNTYGGVGTENNHVNMNVPSSESYYQTAYDSNGYGGMQYYSSSNCAINGSTSGCITNYNSSEVKYVVDAWKNANAPLATEARLLAYDEIQDNFELKHEEIKPCGDGCGVIINRDSFNEEWMYNNNYGYWVISDSLIYLIYSNGAINSYNIVDDYHAQKLGMSYVIRPVITISKSNLSS